MPRRARLAVTLAFFAAGGSFGTWVARIPALRDRLGATEGELGLALFGVAAGAVVALPVAGWASARLGSRRVALAALLATGLALPLPALAPNLLVLGLAFGALGVAAGMLDLAMNAHGVAVEARYDRPILSSFHAAFSLGGLVGAGAGGVAAGLGVPPLAHFAAAGLVLCAVAPWARRGLLPRDVDVQREGPVFGRPSRSLVALGVLAFAVLFAEGAAADWSALYLHDWVGTGEGAATTAFVAFSLTMTLGRLAGDRLTAALGPVTLTRLGGALAAGGLATALLVREPVVAVAGFACLGAGLAAGIPIVFRAAGQRAPSPGAGIAAVSTVGYSAFLAGPPLIGLLAEATTLPFALGVVVVPLAATMVALAGATRAA